MKRRKLLCAFALLGALAAQAGDVLVLRFRDGTAVQWRCEELPVVQAGRDCVSVKAAGQTVDYPSRAVKAFFIDDEANAVERLEQDAPALQVTIEGRTILFDGTATLYTIDGKLVATGSGRVTAPQGGIYVLRASKKSVKVLLP